MYTQSSIDLKSDFYCRYGLTRGTLFFERTQLPCSILDSGRDYIAFGLDCGVRAYGRGYGDVLRVIDANSDVCDVRFVKDGRGAQILYKADIADISGIKNMVSYTIDKLLSAMGRGENIKESSEVFSVCDRYAPKGWCAAKYNGEVKSVPFPVSDYNVILIRTRKKHFSSDTAALKRFSLSETDRIEAAIASLKECRTDIFFSVVNESQSSIERLLGPSEEQLCAAQAARTTDGVVASRICEAGIIAFCDKSKTDSAVHDMHTEGLRYLGYPLGVCVVK